MTDIIIVGEDEVTREIIKRLLQKSEPPFRVLRQGRICPVFSRR